MHKSNISMLKGDLYSRAMLEEVVVSNRDIGRHLEPLLENLDELIEANKFVYWWLALDNDVPVGFICVYLRGNESHHLFSWINAVSSSQYEEIIFEMVKYWIDNSDVETFVADVAPNSTLIDGLINSGFKYLKTIISANTAKTRFSIVDVPDHVIVRKPKREEISEIFNQLIRPDLTHGSSAEITIGQFKHFARNMENSDSWVIVINADNEQLMGVGASFVENRGDGDKPYLYGPHATDPEIEYLIISEFMTYWKMKKYEVMRIYKFGELHQDTINELNISQNQSFSIDRYSYFKNKLNDYYM